MTVAGAWAPYLRPAGQAAPAPQAATPAASDGRMHPNDVELASLRAQVAQQDNTIRHLQISLGVALLSGPVLGIIGYLVRGRRRA